MSSRPLRLGALKMTVCGGAVVREQQQSTWVASGADEAHWRAEATRCALERDRLYREAASAHARGRHDAAELVARGKEMAAQMREMNRKARAGALTAFSCEAPVEALTDACVSLVGLLLVSPVGHDRGVS
jgi:hypothetical protein